MVKKFRKTRKTKRKYGGDSEDLAENKRLISEFVFSHFTEDKLRRLENGNLSQSYSYSDFILRNENAIDRLNADDARWLVTLIRKIQKGKFAIEHQDKIVSCFYWDHDYILIFVSNER